MNGPFKIESIEVWTELSFEPGLMYQFTGFTLACILKTLVLN